MSFEGRCLLPEEYTRRTKLRDWSIASGLVVALAASEFGLLYGGAQIVKGVWAAVHNADAYRLNFSACDPKDLQVEAAPTPGSGLELTITQALPRDGAIEPYRVVGVTLVGAAFSARGFIGTPNNAPQASKVFEHTPPPFDGQTFNTFHIPPDNTQQSYDVYQISRMESTVLPFSDVEYQVSRCGSVVVNTDPHDPAAQPSITKHP